MSDIAAWAVLSPEGEYTGDDETIILDRNAPSDEQIERLRKGEYFFEQVCLIDPQKLQRLRKIEEWAKEAYAIIAGEWSFSKFLEEYDAIITEAKHDKD